MTTFILSRDDVRTDIHTRMWEDLCDALGVGPEDQRIDDYPDEVEIKAAQKTAPS